MANDYKNVSENMKQEAKKLMTDKQIKDCNIAIHAAAVAAGAGGIIPVPVMDSIPISAAQVAMVIALGNIFDKKITESAAKGVIGAAASTLVGRSLVKLIPIAGWIASAAVAAGVTEAIGWTIAVDFAKIRNLENEKNTNNIAAENKDMIEDTIEEKEKNEELTVDEEWSDNEMIKEEFDDIFGEDETE